MVWPWILESDTVKELFCLKEAFRTLMDVAIVCLSDVDFEALREFIKKELL